MQSLRSVCWPGHWETEVAHRMPVHFKPSAAAIKFLIFLKFKEPGEEEGPEGAERRGSRVEADRL